MGVFPSVEFLEERRMSSREFLLVAGVGVFAALVGVVLSPDHPVEAALVAATPVLGAAVLVLMVVRSGRKTGARKFDPATIGDPVALSTGWGPVNRGWDRRPPWETGRCLVRVSPLRMEIRDKPRGFLVARLAILALPFLAMAVVLGSSGSRFVAASLAIGGVGLAVLVLASRLALAPRGVEVSLDRRGGRLGGGQPLSEAHAVQLIDKLAKVQGRHGPRYRLGFEVNVVFPSGERANVVECDRPAEARRCAQELSEFLGLPLWESSLPPRRPPASASVSPEDSGALKRLLSRRDG